jgi:mono/diheme cytochrome c family protein
VAPSLFKGKGVETAFRDSCSGCHGPNREGASGPALIPARLGTDDASYFDVIKNGKPGTVMPTWGPLACPMRRSGP